MWEVKAMTVDLISRSKPSRIDSAIMSAAVPRQTTATAMAEIKESSGERLAVRKNLRATNQAAVRKDRIYAVTPLPPSVLEQEGADELVEVSVHDVLDAAGLDVGAVVLH